MHVNSLFKVGEGTTVGAQLDVLLGFISTVLDYTQSWLTNCELERKTLHGDRVFCLCVLCQPTAFCQHFCIPPILTNYIQNGRGESFERHNSKFQNLWENLSFTLSILRSVLMAAFPNTSEKQFWQIFGFSLNKQCNLQRSNICHPSEVRKRWMNMK